MTKPHFGPDLGPLGRGFFLIKNLALSVARYYGQLSSCIISEKTNDLLVSMEMFSTFIMSFQH